MKLVSPFLLAWKKMEALNFNSIRTNRFKRKPTNTHRSKQLLSISLLTIFFVLFFCFSNKYTIHSLFFPNPLKTTRFPQCVKLNQVQTLKGQKFLWYAPHSGFSNQLSEFKNAVLMSAILNRTLIIPPVLDHHAVVLGSCPKFRVSDPKELRFAVWNHAIELIQSRRYVSMADIIDLSSLVSDSAVEVIDFRNFVSLFCDIDFNYFCAKDSKMEEPWLENLSQCGSLLSGDNANSNDCVYAVEEDCRTTVWTYQNQRDGENGALDSFQPDEQLKKRKKISFIRQRKDVYDALGPHSATILSFGTLFTAPYKGSESYIDIHEAPNDKKIQSLLTKVEFLPFVPEILNAGRKYARHTVKSPFLCAQLRLLDGQFKNHWRGTFQGLKQKVDLLREKEKERLPVHIFVMTDLPMSNWSGTYLGDLANDMDTIKLFVLSEEDELIRKTAMKVVDGGFLKKDCGMRAPDILLHVEESVCSCASLGFFGTAGSTIADTIEMMRKKQICST